MSIDNSQARDPICGKTVQTLFARTYEYKGRKYHFCSEGCRHRFEEKAERRRVSELAKLGALFQVGGGEKLRWGQA